jgi:hypothetical protein
LIGVIFRLIGVIFWMIGVIFLTKNSDLPKLLRWRTHFARTNNYSI